MESDRQLDIMSAEDMSKFAAGDVADALKRVSGVNVVEGQFAIIRGLDDRYNSSIYNGAPIPSPDPDRQSVQLDLFPSDIVSNLVVSKTFGPDLPSNSAGGAIDIISHDYPESFELKLSGSMKLNSNAIDDGFLRLDRDSPVGIDTNGLDDLLGSEYGLSVGGRGSFLERELRYKAVLNRELEFDTAQGTQESREPNFARPDRSGDLSLGELSLSGGRFDLTQSDRSEQRTGYLGLGFDVDAGGNHKLDGSAFYTRKDEETIELRENGFFPNVDYSELAALQREGRELPAEVFTDRVIPGTWLAQVRSEVGDAQSRGPLWSASFSESEAFQRERDLRVFQLNGDHRIELLPGLRLRWAANQATTNQSEDSRAANLFFEPEDPEDLDDIPTRFPVTVDALGPGTFYSSNGILFSSNDVEETQNFVRVDAEYERSLFEQLTLRVSGGLWYEESERDVTSEFLDNIFVDGRSQFAIPGDTPAELGRAIFDAVSPSGLRETSNESSREIRAFHLGAKATLFGKLDVLAGFRRESIFIESLNDPFIDQVAFDGSPAIFPTKWLLFDRFDNPARREPAAPPGTVFNDELLGIETPKGPCRDLAGEVLPGSSECVDLIDRAEIESLINGEIDEKKLLPSLGLTLRPLDGLSIRGSFSRTVARPSFRELGFYLSVKPGNDDLFIGNPQLQLSDVESWDTRIEYAWGTTGDLVALSLFTKTIEDPIEAFVVRNPANRDLTSDALFRTFFNNPSEATLRGFEVEARKNAGFLGFDFAQYFSVGGNFTYIDAEVDRTEAELARSERFFGTVDGVDTRFPELEESRRLFNQPEWIANLDLTFDQPEWETKVTLAFFAISDVLDAAGSASIGPDGTVRAFTLDRFVDSFHQLDLVASQSIPVRFGEVSLKLSAKNLTDSKRGITFDPDQTRDEVDERTFRVGRDFSLSLTYKLSF
jgi:outer membrane receptor protein involved in Fe transport